MVKEKRLILRIEDELKKKVEVKATSKGLSLSAYIRMTLIGSLDQ